MKKNFVLSVFVSMCLAAAAFAQTDKASFAGEWELDVSRSTLPETMQIEAMTLKVAQTDKELSVQAASKRAKGTRGGMRLGGVEPLLTYTLDGKETTSETGSGAMASKVTRKAVLTADGKLNLTITHSFSGANSVTLKTNEIWELADAGRTLKVTRYMETPRGAVNAEMFFIRKPALNTASAPVLEYKGPVMNSTDSANQINGGVLNGKAKTLVKPAYPPAARAVKARGAVSVQVVIDELGNISSANAISGHPLLRAAAEEAARSSVFEPTLLEGQPVRVSGIIVYNFVP